MLLLLHSEGPTGSAQTLCRNDFMVHLCSGDKAAVCKQGGLYWGLLSHKVVESHGLMSVTLYMEQ